MSVVGYARVSTRDQNLDPQFLALSEAGATKIFQEKISGVRANRPQLSALIDYVREGDIVCITKLDRIARSTKHLLSIVETLKSKGVEFKVLNINLDTSTPTGLLMLTMLGAIATFEREMMLERQSEGIAIAKMNGRYKGRKPTAMDKSEDVMRLVKSGITSRQIAETLSISVASVHRIKRASQTSQV